MIHVLGIISNKEVEKSETIFQIQIEISGINHRLTGHFNGRVVCNKCFHYIYYRFFVEYEISMIVIVNYSINIFMYILKYRR